MYPISQTLGALTAAEESAKFFNNIVSENTTSSRQLIIHEVMGRNCGWLTAYSAYLYLNEFLKSNSDKISGDVLICTVLAGVDTQYFSKFIKNRIIRLMPNLSIKNNTGFIPYTKTYKEDYLSILEILSGLGEISEYEEDLFHIITAIYGSGPAWYLELSSKISEAAEELGLSKQDSNNIVSELVKSLPSLITGEEFAETVEKIKSPKGTTEAGLNSLTKDSFDKIIFNAINSATERSVEISKEINDE